MSLNVKNNIINNKIKGVSSMNNARIKARLDRYVDKICGSYLHLYSLEQQGERANKTEIINALEELGGVFNSEYADMIFDLTKANHRNSREILYVGSLFHSFAGNKEMSIRYYNGLADYYKQLGKKLEYQKYIDIIKKLQAE